MSVITNFLGLNPTGPTEAKKKSPKALGRLSLSQLTARIEDLNRASQLGVGNVKSEKQKIDPLTGRPVDPDTGKDTGLTGLKARRDKSDLDLTLGEANTQQQKDIANRLKKFTTQRRKLVTRVTGQRTQRATRISTLLGRGI